MTNSTDTSENTSDFRRGHRVRFANGPVMTVMDFTYDEIGEIVPICGWWDEMQLSVGAFHPDVLIHTDAEYTLPMLYSDPDSAEEFQEFHSE